MMEAFMCRRFVIMHKIMFGCAMRSDEPKTFITSSKGFRDELVPSMQRKLTLFFVHIAEPVMYKQGFDTLILIRK